MADSQFLLVLIVQILNNVMRYHLKYLKYIHHEMLTSRGPNATNRPDIRHNDEVMKIHPILPIQKVYKLSVISARCDDD